MNRFPELARLIEIVMCVCVCVRDQVIGEPLAVLRSLILGQQVFPMLSYLSVSTLFLPNFASPCTYL